MRVGSGLSVARLKAGKSAGERACERDGKSAAKSAGLPSRFHRGFGGMEFDKVNLI